ncbi:hypothetical protein EVAR_42085_1 [Eumeta japonica]|uniref:Cation/H+ exchanger transmembrane domain-containing protein n=1 Tax=Eumeta variegata TaxID=151549 RepID=A0A4C1XEJ4_EUMVA|nr:hypothetical protein EVAR_42085_1 [Eumeta japonica]
MQVERIIEYAVAVTGLIVGAIIRYGGNTNQVTHIDAHPDVPTGYNLSVPPDIIRFLFPGKLNVSSDVEIPNKTYAYIFRGEIVNLEQNEIDLKATFDPEIFFNIILPPIIFHAGYCLKRKYFFRNLGAILTFAMVGTALSALVIGGLMYGCVQLMPASLAASFTFLDTLYFGALISPTDPLTVLAIFSQLKVDVNLYAMIFGESVLNDAVALVLSGAIQNYEKRYSTDGGFEIRAFLAAIGDFIAIFGLSLLITSTLGRAVNIYPLSFLLNLGRKPPIPMNFQHMLFFSGLRGAMSFALAIRNTVSEARQAMLTTTSLIVIATVVLQGGAATHALAYFRIPTGESQSDESDALPYRDVRSSTDLGFGLRNLDSAQPTGDRGSRGRMIVKWGKDETAVNMPWQLDYVDDNYMIMRRFEHAKSCEEATDVLSVMQYMSVWRQETPRGPASGSGEPTGGEKARLARLWGALDSRLLKPLLTHARPPLTDTLPAMLSPVARLLTTTQQYTQADHNLRRTDSDSDICLDESQPGPTTIDPQQLWPGLVDTRVSVEGITGSNI